MELLKGLPAAKRITEEVREQAAGLKRKPKLVIVRVGEDPDAVSYENAAKKRMEKTGIDCEVYVFPADVDEEVFYAAYAAINQDAATNGVLLFRPLPKRFSMERVEALTDPVKDVDGMCALNMGKLYKGEPCAHPCTAQAVLEILDEYGISVSGKRVVVLGRSTVIGRPVALLLMHRNATVTVCHTKTEDLKARAREADILVAAVGKAEMVDESYIKEGAVVIDVGINVREDGTLAGDCDPESVSEKASAITPVPGGVGAVTTSVLAKNVLEAAKRREEEEGKMDAKIRIRYISKEIDPLCYVDGKSDWIDLRCARETVLKQGEAALIPLGVAMQLPEGYEAHVVARSSSYKNFGIIQTNTFGIVDESYSGDNDEWRFPVIAMRDTVIHVNDRIAQFRIEKHQPAVIFEEVEHLDGKDRGGFGTTGIS